MGTWTTGAETPTSRSNLGAAELNGAIYAIGGDDGVWLINTNQAFTPARAP